MPILKTFSIALVCASALLLSACHPFAQTNNGESQCWPGSTCWKQLSAGQQNSKRTEWMADRQDMLNDTQTLRRHGFGRINPVSTS